MTSDEMRSAFTRVARTDGDLLATALRELDDERLNGLAWAIQREALARLDALQGRAKVAADTFVQGAIQAVHRTSDLRGDA